MKEETKNQNFKMSKILKIGSLAFLVIFLIVLILPEVTIFMLKNRPDKRQELLQIIEQAVSEREAEEKRKQEIADAKKVFSPKLSLNFPHYGNIENPKLTIVEYTNFLCPHCKVVALETIPALMKRHSNQVAVFIKPVSFDSPGQLIDRIFIAIHKQNPKLAIQFYEYVFRNQENILKDIKNNNGLNIKHLVSPIIDDFLAKSAKEGLIDLKLTKKYVIGKESVNALQDIFQEYLSFGFDSTPTLLINGKKIVGSRPIEEYENFVQKVLQENPNYKAYILKDINTDVSITKNEDVCIPDKEDCNKKDKK